MVSLGGQAIKASTFSSFITDLKSLNNLTSSINKLYRDGIVDGVELDWEWPFSNGKKDRIKLIRYARVSLFILLLSMAQKAERGHINFFDFSEMSKIISSWYY